MHEAAHSHVADGNWSLFLPGGDRDAASCSPLEGDCRLRADKTTQPDPQGSGFFLSGGVTWKKSLRFDRDASNVLISLRELAQRHGRCAEKNIDEHEKYRCSRKVSA
jgi:hypothetical protein